MSSNRLENSLSVIRVLFVHIWRNGEGHFWTRMHSLDRDVLPGILELPLFSPKKKLRALNGKDQCLVV